MTITKALIIDDPWIGLILAGEKTWEMRSTGASHRGWFGLVRKGSGAVCGVARLVDVRPPLSPEDMIATHEKHRIPAEMIRGGAVAKWNTPWVLADARPVDPPVPYRHRSGAVTWVELDEAAREALAARLAGRAAAPDEPTKAVDRAPSSGEPDRKLLERASRPPAALPTNVAPRAGRISAVPRTGGAETDGGSGMWGETTLTQGNIDNHHFYMRNFVHRFPDDLIGGSNKAQAAPRTALVDWGGPAPVETDIDGQKLFFRRRGWVRRFFADNGAEAGDVVRVEETGPYCYRVSLVGKGRS